MTHSRQARNDTFFDIAPLRSDLPFGVIVSGLDPAQLEDKALKSALMDLWIDEGLIIFKGLTGQETHIRLSLAFGELTPHPIREIETENKMLVNVPFDPATGLIVDIDGEQRGLAQAWHTDLIYSDKVNRGGILRPIELPTYWGETGFIDQIWAYETLPDALKSRIDGLHVVYRYNVDPAIQKFGVQHKITAVRFHEIHKSIQSRLDDFPPVIHPLVYTQAETGRKVLNLSPWFSTGIFEIPGEEGNELLEQVARHIVDGGHEYLHKWSMDEMVLFDNWRMLHCGAGTPIDQRRLMQRTNILGDYGLGRVKPGAGLAVAQNEYVIL